MEYSQNTEPEIYSYEQYLALEKKNEELRYEFYDGEIVAMAGAHIRHARIVTNTSNRIFDKLREGNCDVFAEAVKLEIPQTNHYLYPDVLVTCNPLDMQSRSGIRNPMLVVEVLSPSSIRRDKVKKLAQYLRLPSLKYYLIISQEECRVEVYKRQGEKSWIYTIYDEMSEDIYLPEWEITLQLKDIYRKVVFGVEKIEEEEGEYLFSSDY
ncbi:MAG: Uma2 family endonuclease [Bacteroidia bacterium]|nr:Uma2 family endonuclease [Bacteroidia bacterium]